ncbi:MAG TPA: amino acid racemase [Terriglobales bacterium]|jgi:aspartate racemase|nr:amino acid racemase [Terriglobales bacterium]
MKLAGIIGGTGPESTIDYYRQIIAVYRQQRPDGSYPPMLINSIDLKRAVDLVTAGDLAGLTAYLVEAFERLARAGADFGLISANTPHIFFDEVRRRSPLPLISIVETTCRAVRAQGLQKVGLLGTRFTMTAGFYQKPFSEQGIALVVPGEAERAWVHEIYMGELVNGIFLPATRERLLRVIEDMRQRDAIQGVILGGTELPLILRDAACPVPLLDTTRIHVQEIVAAMLG